MIVRIAWAWQNGAPSRWLLRAPQPTALLRVEERSRGAQHPAEVPGSAPRSGMGGQPNLVFLTSKETEIHVGDHHLGL